MTSAAPSNDQGQNPQRRREPSLSPPPYVLNKHGSRVLDPDSAIRLKGQVDIRATVYVGASMLCAKTDWDNDTRMREALDAAAELVGLKLGASAEFDRELAAAAERAGLTELSNRLLTVRIGLEPIDDSMPSAPPDAWQVVQNFRAQFSDEPEMAAKITLDHLMTASGIGGVGYMGTGYMGTGYMGTGYMGTGYMGTGLASPSAEYGLPGHGGRAPVTWLGPEPTRCSDSEVKTRRPVVAVLDTGAGKHPWLPDSIVDRDPTIDGSVLIGLEDGQYNPEVHGSVNDPLEGVLDAVAGHGTFIAGLIRQTCPDANILAVRVMHGDGAVVEFDLLKALNRLVLRQAIAIKQQDATRYIDVLSLSLGYYHELPADQAMDHKLLKPLTELGQLGVVTIAAAGNDATDRHFYPAGFAPHHQTQLPAVHDALPVVSVGAENPNQRFAALFSNDGDWVSCQRQGAALVSTMPIELNGALRPGAELRLSNGETRSTIDPDDYSGGFGTWSGTSFAAPVLAGQVAEFLRPCPSFGVLTAAAAVDRGWEALHALVPLDRPAP
jgi:hypothetical protein